MTERVTRLYVGTTVQASCWAAAARSWWERDRTDADRGDVPGWVLVTVMTAGLVAALWRIALPLLQNRFRTAVNGVHP